MEMAGLVGEITCMSWWIPIYQIYDLDCGKQGLAKRLSL